MGSGIVGLCGELEGSIESVPVARVRSGMDGVRMSTLGLGVKGQVQGSLRERL